MPIIEVENVSKRYRAARGHRALLGRGGLPELLRARRPDEVTALEGISFSVEPGESLGLIGANGSGKSTLLKLVAGVTVPSEGSVRVYGRVASLLELGAGFHPLLSGRENIYLNAGLHGVHHAQVDAIFDRIVEFSGIAKFIESPVSTYSSGMYVRLGFAIAAHLDPDIFLIDEVLAVGDESFQRKCRAKIGELIELGKTILFVSHDLSLVNVLCRRVVLLSQGKMIARGTPAKAIDFYLRQIGAPQGVHTLRAGKAEVIVSNGRLSVYYDQEEITTPQGFRSHVYRMGGWRGSLDADWTITEATQTRCVARGHDSRLGMTLVWDIAFEGHELVWSSRYEIERPIEIEMIETTLFFPVDYTGWVYDERVGDFHDIAPDDTAWVETVAPEPLCETAAILSPESSKRPVVMMTLSGQGPRSRGSWSNSEYLSKSRVFRIEETFDKRDLLPAGTHPFVTLRLDFEGGREAIRGRMEEQGAQRTVAAGPLHARFDHGQLRLTYGGRPISAVVHGYASLLIQDLWNDSVNLRWDRAEREGDALRVNGSSRRFPFRMHWTVSPEPPAAIAWTIDLEAMDELDVQEYQASVFLVEEYARWQTVRESGAFPPIRTDDEEWVHLRVAPGRTSQAQIRTDDEDWVHLNRDYSEGTFLRAEGPGLPAVTLQNDDIGIPLRMTALNPGFRQRARVLQALRPADHGPMHFSRGTHRIFTGRIVVAAE